jgi:cytidine deaminase
MPDLDVILDVIVVMGRTKADAIADGHTRSTTPGEDMAPYDRETLLQKARDIAKNAWVPYSRFRVGAIVVADGRLFHGVNVENSSYGLSLCAERSALAAALAAGAQDITDLAVSCIDADESAGAGPRVPCGACRQWLADVAPNVVILVDGLDRVFRLSDMLPIPFSLG